MWWLLFSIAAREEKKKKTRRRVGGDVVGGKRRSRAKEGKEEDIGIGIARLGCRLKKGISPGGFGLDFGRRRRNPKTPKMRWRAMWWEE